MKLDKITRRRFLRAALYSTPPATVAYTWWWEPEWIKTRTVRLAQGTPAHRFVHFTDLHHKGDRDFLEKVVRRMNELSPEFVCFTGDLVEEARHLDEALEVLRTIKAPLYGVPGNHDYWSGVEFEPIAECFAATGGAWLMDRQIPAAGGKVNIIGATCMDPFGFAPKPGVRNIVLIHYPAWVEKLGAGKFDAILAGHSHGGQVRFPFFGPLAVPFGVGRYDLGLFQTAAGPLSVNPGIGWFFLPLRFRCRPEITVLEI